MSLADYKVISEIAKNVLMGLSIIIGASWAVYRFILQKERYPNINFTTDIVIIGTQDGNWIVELIATIENKGKAQHRMNQCGFDLNAIFENEILERSDKWNGQLNFPNKISQGSFLPGHIGYFFVDPGTSAKYSHVTTIPMNASYAILHSNFGYTNRNGAIHTAERTIKMEMKKN